eukprot:3765804-Pleurochrysis_carterae.AAC.2
MARQSSPTPPTGLCRVRSSSAPHGTSGGCLQLACCDWRRHGHATTARSPYMILFRYPLAMSDSAPCSKAILSYKGMGIEGAGEGRRKVRPWLPSMIAYARAELTFLMIAWSLGQSSAACAPLRESGAGNEATRGYRCSLTSLVWCG